MDEKNGQVVCANSKTEIEDRVKGAVFGACCGNSLAGSTLGLNYRQIAAKAGLSGLRDFTAALSGADLASHQPGDLLSDAQVCLTLAESLTHSKGRFDSADLRQRIARLLQDERFLASHPGLKVLQGLRTVADTRPAAEGQLALHVNAASRACLVGCLPGGQVTDNPVEIAVKQSQLSSADGRAAAAAAVIADSVRYFIAGGKLDTIDDVRQYVRHEFEIAGKLDERFADAWDDIAPDLDYSNQAEDLPYSLVNVEASVTELVPTAVGIFLIFRKHPEEAIIAAARAGGSTDTVATIVGVLSGAYHGASKLPERWLAKIAQKERLDLIAQNLCEFWV